MTTVALYLADFPAWVRRWIDPARPRACVYADERVISACEELRSCGLRVGESVARARTLYPDAAFHRHDPHLDAATWEDILYLVADAAPRLRPVRPGWIILEPYDAAALEELNRTLGGRLGIAPTARDATLAALAAREGEALRLAPGDAGAFVARSSIVHLEAFGISPEAIDRLRLFGLVTLGHVAALTLRHLTAQFGAEGAALYDLLHPPGDDPPLPIFQPPPSVSSTFDFDDPVIEPRDLDPVLDMLVHEAIARLTTRHASIATLRVHGGGQEGMRAARRVLKTPTARAAKLLVVARTLLAELMRTAEPATSMTFVLGGLVDAGGVQGGLFENRPALYEAVRALDRRFPGRVKRAVITNPAAYLPERGIRIEAYPLAPEPQPGRGSMRRRGACP